MSMHSGEITKCGYDCPGDRWTCCGQLVAAAAAIAGCGGFHEHHGVWVEDSAHQGCFYSCCGCLNKTWSCTSTSADNNNNKANKTLAHTGMLMNGVYDVPGKRWTCCGGNGDVDRCNGFQRHIEGGWKDDKDGHGGGWWICCGCTLKDASCVEASNHCFN